VKTTPVGSSQSADLRANREAWWSRATPFEFRHRVVIIAILYTLGFGAFWNVPVGSATSQTTWLVLSSLLASTHALGLSSATIFVTAMALCCGIIGTALRVWGTAHLGATTMTDGDMRSRRIVASGPYRHIRNPLYLGSWLLSIPILLLMPVAGAIFVLVGLSIFFLRLIAREEFHLGEKLGESYLSYCTRVPRLLPTLVGGVSPMGAQPRWMQALPAEFFALSFTACFAILAWRYNAQLLTRCVLVCFGLSLIVRAMRKPR